MQKVCMIRKVCINCTKPVSSAGRISGLSKTISKEWLVVSFTWQRRIAELISFVAPSSTRIAAAGLAAGAKLFLLSALVAPLLITS
jgi:hypothetical protein